MKSLPPKDPCRKIHRQLILNSRLKWISACRGTCFSGSTFLTVNRFATSHHSMMVFWMCHDCEIYLKGLCRRRKREWSRRGWLRRSKERSNLTFLYCIKFVTVIVKLTTVKRNDLVWVECTWSLLLIYSSDVHIDSFGQ